MAKKFFNRWGNAALDRLEPGDRLSLIRRQYSARLHHYAWDVTELPVRLLSAADSNPADLPQRHEPQAPQGWTERDEDFALGQLVSGHITEIRKMYRSKFLYMLVELADGRVICVNHRALEGSKFSPRDLHVGDVVVLRKFGFSHSASLTDWTLKTRLSAQK